VNKCSPLTLCCQGPDAELWAMPHPCRAHQRHRARSTCPRPLQVGVRL